MVGFIDSKGIRNPLSTQTVNAFMATGSETLCAYTPVFVGVSANGTNTCYPADISALTNLGSARPGRWGICQATTASLQPCKVVVAGGTRLVTGNAVTSGAWVVAISNTGSTTLSATLASLYVGSATALGLYSSALYGSGGMIIW